MVELEPHQEAVLDQLRPGVILQGGVGSGKGIASIAYYYKYELGGSINPISMPKKKVPLYIITTAKKRDQLEWDGELALFSLSRNRDVSIGNIDVVVDSWNNIGKYANVEGAFFILDEQKLVGSGAWVKAFLKIAKANRWILLTATPGDAWIDYAPVFIANGFYRNKTEFVVRHVVYSRFVKYPMIDHYVNVEKLIEHREAIVVDMKYFHGKQIHKTPLIADYDKAAMEIVTKKRWNIYKNKPIKNAGELSALQRRVANSDPSRLTLLEETYRKHPKLIVFYNFNYELFMLRDFLEANAIPYSEWNGHRHEDIRSGDQWIYLVQYTSGAEGWNCIATNAIFFYSQNYSYKVLTQAEGRVNRMNSPFDELYYYYVQSRTRIDHSIASALGKKKNFNEKEYEAQYEPLFALSA